MEISKKNIGGGLGGISFGTSAHGKHPPPPCHPHPQKLAHYTFIYWPDPQLARTITADLISKCIEGEINLDYTHTHTGKPNPT